MLTDKIQYFSRLLGIKLTNYAPKTGWVVGHCPFAPYYPKNHKSSKDSRPSFAILSKEKGRSVFKCFTCHQKGSMPKLAYDLGYHRKKHNPDDDFDYRGLGLKIEEAELYNISLLVEEDWDYETTDEKSENTEEIPEGLFPKALGQPYLKRRGITWKTCLRLGLRFDPDQGRILFPIRDRRGQLVGYTGRSIYPSAQIKVRDYLGFRKRRFFLGESEISDREGHRKIIVVEGVFDYAILRQFEVSNVVASLGTEITKEKIDKLILWNKPIIWMFDNDEAGWDALYGERNDRGRIVREGIMGKLYGHIPQLTVKYPKRFGEGMGDPAELSKKETLRMIKKAKLYTK